MSAEQKSYGREVIYRCVPIDVLPPGYDSSINIKNKDKAAGERQPS